MVALHSGVLQNLRFHGHCASEPDPRFPRHLDLEGARDCPQDAVAGVRQHLFPCPDGVNFVHNERDKDPIGLIAQEQREDRLARHPGPRAGGLRKILALLDATLWGTVDQLLARCLPRDPLAYDLAWTMILPEAVSLLEPLAKGAEEPVSSQVRGPVEPR